MSVRVPCRFPTEELNESSDLQRTMSDDLRNRLEHVLMTTDSEGVKGMVEEEGVMVMVVVDGSNDVDLSKMARE